MRVEISRIEEHTTRVQQIVDGVAELRRPVGSVTIEFKFERSGHTLREKVGDSRGFGRLMNDGHTYHLRIQSDGYAWVTVTYYIRPATANPYRAGNPDKLAERALRAIQKKVDSLA